MKKMTIISIVILTAIMCLAGFMCGDASAAELEGDVSVSCGLQIIANQSGMAKWGESGKDLMFSPEDFERALNLNRVNYITLTSLPDPALGSLCLGSAPVSVGMTVSRENLHKLCYVEKGEGISSNSFSFTTGNGYEFDCAVYKLTENNLCPTAAGVKLFANVSTFRNVSTYGQLTGADGEGDSLTYQVVAYPKNGSIIMTDAQSGEFCYTPSRDFIGKDSFKYVVFDKYGNFSAASTVEIEVDAVKLDGVLCDMGGNRAHASAIAVVQSGIMSASKGESGLTFAPEEKVTREDFLVMAMKAAGIKISEKTSTEFADDSDISAMAKSYVAAAKEKGYINGTISAGKYYFYPDKPITSAEAAVIVNRIIEGSKYIKDTAIKTVFSDHLDIPVWAEDAILTLNYVGVYHSGNGYVYPQSEMTKADAAMILSRIMSVKG